VKYSIKAALLSGLVFPGVGHLYMGRYLRGVLLAAGAAALSYFIISVALNSAIDIAGKIQGGDVPLNVESISQMVSKASQDNEQSTDIATMILFALWAIGIVDSYREGRARDRSKELNTKS
jgi:TM2 domain-containing membrane protein YozV